MLDTYDDTALTAESASEQAAPTAKIAAEQQAPDMVRSAFENLESVVSHNLGHPDDRMKLAAGDARVLLDDFIAGSPASNPPMTEDGRIKTFTEMSDDEIMARLPDYLASGVNSSGINIGTIEEAQAIMAEAFMSDEELQDSPDPKSPKGRAARERKLLDAAREAHEDMNERFESERKRLSKEDQEFLAKQEIDLGNGRSASALDIVNSMDKMLDNWDQSFDEMVDEGIAEPQDKDKLKTAMTKYRNMMADTNLSAEEKERRRREMIASGEITQEQMNYLDKQAEEQKLVRGVAAKVDISQESVRAKADDGGKSTFSVFKPAYASIDADEPTIKTPIKVSKEFVAAANPEANTNLTPTTTGIEVKKTSQVEQPAPTTTAAAASVGWG